MNLLRRPLRMWRKLEMQVAPRVEQEGCRVRPLLSQQEEAMSAMKTLFWMFYCIECTSVFVFPRIYLLTGEAHQPTPTRPAQTSFKSSATVSLLFNASPTSSRTRELAGKQDNYQGLSATRPEAQQGKLKYFVSKN